jgi:hypothetical protein
VEPFRGKVNRRLYRIQKGEGISLLLFYLAQNPVVLQREGDSCIWISLTCRVIRANQAHLTRHSNVVAVLFLQREQARSPRDGVVVARAAADLEALIEHLQIARVDGSGLVGIVPDQIPMADVVGPGGAAVGFAGEGIALGCGQRSPRTSEAGRGEGLEVSPVAPDALDEHEVLVRSLDRVDFYRLEQVVCAHAHDGRVRAAEIAREVSDRHTGSVDASIVPGEEQVCIRAVADHHLVDRTVGRA